MKNPGRVLSIVLAGGEGKRLAPLTTDRTKPAVPFGGNYRLVDFVLSNLVNGGFHRIVVLTQYKSDSLNRHLTRTWRLSSMLGQYVAPVPAQMRRGPRWFSGSADAIFQNLNLLADERPDYVLVFGADHIYRFDPRQMLDQHIESGAGLTVAATRIPIEEATEFGVIDRGPGTQIVDFREKPTDAVGIDGAPDQVFASMGNYIFNVETLIEAVSLDSQDHQSRHDLGGDIVPMLVKSGDAHVYDFASNNVPGATDRDRGYWRDVGTLDSYYDAHMDLISVQPVFNLYNRLWPIYSWHDPLPPAKFVFEESGRAGTAFNSMVSAGVIISGGTVRRSILSPEVRVNSRALVEDSVLMEGVEVGEGSVIRRAIIDKWVEVPPGIQIGVNPEHDRARFKISEGGIVVIGKNEEIPDN
jgi:glucose-1-phosphate adenylyltransferase